MSVYSYIQYSILWIHRYEYESKSTEGKSRYRKEQTVCEMSNDRRLARHISSFRGEYILMYPM